MTDNELIEAFYISQGGKPNLLADIHFYESDWNMLMLVVEKIKELAKANPQLPFTHRLLFHLSILTNIDTVYNATMEVIKWYNENKTI